MSEITKEIDEILDQVKEQLFGLIFEEKYEVVGMKFGHDDSGKCNENCKYCKSGKEKWGLFIELRKRTA